MICSCELLYSRLVTVYSSVSTCKDTNSRSLTGYLRQTRSFNFVSQKAGTWIEVEHQRAAPSPTSSSLTHKTRFLCLPSGSTFPFVAALISTSARTHNQPPHLSFLSEQIIVALEKISGLFHLTTFSADWSAQPLQDHPFRILFSHWPCLQLQAAAVGTESAMVSWRQAFCRWCVAVLVSINETMHACELLGTITLDLATGNANLAKGVYSTC